MAHLSPDQPPPSSSCLWVHSSSRNMLWSRCTGRVILMVFDGTLLCFGSSKCLSGSLFDANQPTTPLSTQRRDSSGRLNVSNVTVLVRRVLLCAMNHPLPAFPCVGRTLRYYCSRRLCAAVLAKRRTFLAVQNRSPAIINHHPLTS